MKFRLQELLVFMMVALLFFMSGCRAEQLGVEVTDTPERLIVTAVPTTKTPEPEMEKATVTAVPGTPTSSADSAEADADVLFVRAEETAGETWHFTVTVAHPDTGWEDYADGWDVVLPDGTVVLPDPDAPFTRLLLHPHETEQPFTRSQSNIHIPAEVTAVTVRAHDLVDGFGGKAVTVDLTTSQETELYEVKRLGD